MIKDTRALNNTFPGITLFAEGIVSDGHFGDKALCEFGLKGNKIVTVHSFGYYNAGLPDVVDTDEALWIINNHPSARHMRVVD